MSIYTKTGDKGSTSLFDGKRVKKYDLRVDTYGTFDECLAQISVAEKQVTQEKLKEPLKWIQEKLFQVNAEIATSENMEKLTQQTALIDQKDIERLEKWIDEYTEILPSVNQFILHGKMLPAAQLHVARTVCRRGERRLVELAEVEKIRKELQKFINRLSDCLYMLARMSDYLTIEEMVRVELERTLEMKMETEKEHYSFFTIQKVFNACIAEAKQMNLSATMAIVDKSGILRASFSMENSLLVSVEMAQKKAYTAVAMRQSTKDLHKLTQIDAPFFQLEALTEGKIVTFAGGVPLCVNGKIVAGLGISGGSVEEDEKIACIGKKAFEEVDYAGKGA
ncbi:ATP:cob(I)alamin adenosyltransferase [Pilibacter termitis]|uniref:Corrinoid adenosyltransferase n=1 Tax=Pilibacter termitis TaxID=263852 RepID=A0A1T4MKA3_9ENTE|nr:cob(I)yrinic acid a,c-diamide adenosyltransferase [Pilibacter termitis]SJZ67184.1 ATP:cob(I)alamin adenosyltransferase [Pilibacter termitis]